ncbi:bifunctional metallophosphatase/5'-nucleotidase [Lactobacillus mulieris]|uniref:Bifunctional metallophosphatase/5'-nucleotidase n=1 Tax=Lactobacillus mulieris TaxID=2508708 RepID=A0AAW5WYI6_9LACO|nr:bifunctional UDP-sugar hydrolase/5'-nucleotidase [Lactobacillus mulieris]MCZ3622483.1 bifunctional metallophosphatase/5'-nucleotidase [Lactobacillus mulieris]MCZ3624096.1 bifunctional metallophosphatase/5'-nucleotidase [Lactobacillus mulieris]MCZ3636490.1 bifunctional metallophosphatase/5'-nucleotidase [Lactobacillus mulieris]MCZ3690288.1 bifunctional metallophosphatase/5'-nucleotidase [Lactobacillus mulieris]MCZ3696128.1 bifunctional metallophosphatase/5'-nucleotidase [Lactobacillus mulier
MEKIRILHTNDLHSHFEKFPKIKRFLNAAQKDNTVDQVYTFDAGDFMDRSNPLSDATNGHANIELMNQFNYDAVTIGNNEGISNPHEVVEHLFDYAQFPTVLANLREEDESMPKWCTSYKIFTTKKKTRIAVIGLTAPYPMTYGPNHWHVKMLGEVLPDLLTALKGKYDILVGLTHIGVNLDSWIAEKFSEFDLIVGGHTHTLLETGKWVNNTLIVQTGKWGRYVGDVNLIVDDHHKITSMKACVHETAQMAEQAQDLSESKALFEKGKQLLEKEKIADLPALFADDKEEALAVSLDAIADFAGTDLAMLSTGLFLTPFKQGIMTRFDLQTCLPHPMHVVRTTLKGSDLWRLVMEIEKNRHFLRKFHLIGMSFRGKVFGEVYYRNIQVDMKTRLVYVNGEEIDPDRYYQIATLDHYILIPFFPTLAVVGENEFLFPKVLSQVIGEYLAKKYPIKKGEVSGRK